MVGELAQVIIQFSRAFDEALPGLDKTEMDWRSHFMAGAMAHTLCNADLLASFTGTDAGAEGYEATVQRLVEYAAGFRERFPPLPRNKNRVRMVRFIFTFATVLLVAGCASRRGRQLKTSPPSGAVVERDASGKSPRFGGRIFRTKH